MNGEKKSLKKRLKSYLTKQGVLNLPVVFQDIKQIGDLSHQETEIACRAACLPVYLGKDVVLCRVLTKFIVFADAGDVGITPHFCLQGYWETWLTKLFAQMVQKDFFCVDIGANHGYFSLLMADIAGVAGRILAVEPNPNLAELLAQNLEVNGFRSISTVCQKAVADTDGEKLKLVIPGGRDLNATIIASEQSPGDKVFEVETATLDELTKDWARVDFVKIDAEGAEEAIWRGMSHTIEKNPQITVVMEFKQKCASNPKVFLESIVNAGFPLRYVDYDSQVKDLTIERTLAERLDEDWMLFLRREQ